MKRIKNKFASNLDVSLISFLLKYNRNTSRHSGKYIKLLVSEIWFTVSKALCIRSVTDTGRGEYGIKLISILPHAELIMPTDP